MRWLGVWLSPLRLHHWNSDSRGSALTPEKLLQKKGELALSNGAQGIFVGVVKPGVIFLLVQSASGQKSTHVPQMVKVGAAPMAECLRNAIYESIAHHHQLQ